MVRQSAVPAPLDVTSFGSRCASLCLRCCAKLRPASITLASTAAFFQQHGYCQLPANRLPLLLGLRASTSSWKFILTVSPAWKSFLHCPGLRFHYEHWMLHAAALHGTRKCRISWKKTVLKKPLWRTLIRRPSVFIVLCRSMETFEYPISSIVKMMVMEFKHCSKRLRIVMKHLSHPVPNIFQSQISTLETPKNYAC